MDGESIHGRSAWSPQYQAVDRDEVAVPEIARGQPSTAQCLVVRDGPVERSGGEPEIVLWGPLSLAMAKGGVAYTHLTTPTINPM